MTFVVWFGGVVVEGGLSLSLVRLLRFFPVWHAPFVFLRCLFACSLFDVYLSTFPSFSFGDERLIL